MCMKSIERERKGVGGRVIGEREMERERLGEREKEREGERGEARGREEDEGGKCLSSANR